jgi:hypothetical protein
LRECVVEIEADKKAEQPGSRVRLAAELKARFARHALRRNDDDDETL